MTPICTLLLVPPPVVVVAAGRRASTSCRTHPGLRGSSHPEPLLPKMFFAYWGLPLPNFDPFGLKAQTYRGSTGGPRLAKPIVAMAPTPRGLPSRAQSMFPVPASRGRETTRRNRPPRARRVRCRQRLRGPLLGDGRDAPVRAIGIARRTRFTPTSLSSSRFCSRRDRDWASNVVASLPFRRMTKQGRRTRVVPPDGLSARSRARRGLRYLRSRAWSPAGLQIPVRGDSIARCRRTRSSRRPNL